MNISKLARETFVLHNSHGDPIRGDLRYAEEGHKRPVVIICHSFMAFKDWGFFPYIGEKLAEAGFAAITFNFSHNGVDGDGNRITDFNKFESNTFSQELEDLRVLVDVVAEGGVGAQVSDSNNIILLGHSRGGGIAIVHTASDERVKRLVTWSSISTFDRWTKHQKEVWKKLGYLPLARDTTAAPLRLGLRLLHDLESHSDRLSIIDAAARVQVPWLILHGKADVTVQSREASNLYAAANRSTTELVLLDRVGHSYDAASPGEDNYQMLNYILNRTIDWYHRNFTKELAWNR